MVAARAAAVTDTTGIAGADMTTLPNASQQQLRQFIEQIERLEEEKKAIADDVKEKFLEAKAVGFDVKVMRQVLRLRKKSLTERQEEERPRRLSARARHAGRRCADQWARARRLQRQRRCRRQRRRGEDDGRGMKSGCWDRSQGEFPMTCNL